MDNSLPYRIQVSDGLGRTAGTANAPPLATVLKATSLGGGCLPAQRSAQHGVKRSASGPKTSETCRPPARAV
jgi:hypothetical protein